jgi:GNAT superfamily N-acetyltransferase
MATIHADIPQGLSRPPEPRIIRVPPARTRQAIARLLGPRSTTAPEEFMAVSREDGLDLSLIWAVEHPAGELGEVVLITLGTGKTAAAFVSGSGQAPASTASERQRLREERTEVVKAACNWLVGPGRSAVGEIHLAQCLLDPPDEHLAPALIDAGFARLAELAYMRVQLPAKGRAPAPAPWPAGVRVLSLSDLDASIAMPHVQAAMESSYVGTLDCPALCGIREPSDVLESHLGVGERDPRLWFVVYERDRPEGCMLLSPCPGQESVELVYLGLGPALRGKGLARQLLQLAMFKLAGRPERSLACAVDMANAPAIKLYKDAKFRQFATRTALVRSLRS